MEDSATEKKLKWPENGPNDPTKFALHYPPQQPIHELLMCRDGHFRRDGELIFLTSETAE